MCSSFVRTPGNCPVRSFPSRGSGLQWLSPVQQRFRVVCDISTINTIKLHGTIYVCRMKVTMRHHMTLHVGRVSVCRRFEVWDFACDVEGLEIVVQELESWSFFGCRVPTLQHQSVNAVW